MTNISKNEVLKALALDFDQYDYYGTGLVYRVDKSGKTEVFKDGGWVKTSFDVAGKASDVFEGADIDVFLEGDEDYMVEMAMDEEEDDEE